MPTISEFFGIKITMRFLDHNPPHFHAKYQKGHVLIDIEDGNIAGEMSERALRMIFEWMDLHRDELRKAWDDASNGIEPQPIEPLK